MNKRRRFKQQRRIAARKAERLYVENELIPLAKQAIEDLLANDRAAMALELRRFYREFNEVI